MEFWIALSILTGTAMYLTNRVFRVPAGLVARHGQHLYRPGWHFQFFLDPLEIISISPRTVSVDRHTILLPDGSELAVSFVITWTPDTRYLPTFVNQETETIEKLLTVAARSAFLKWGMHDDARNLHRVLSSQKNAEKFVADALIEVSVSLGVCVNRVNITEVKPVSLPQEGRWGTADLGDRAAVVRKRIEAFDQIEATRATLKKDFPSRADDVDDESDFERIRVKEKRR